LSKKSDYNGTYTRIVSSLSDAENKIGMGNDIDTFIVVLSQSALSENKLALDVFKLISQTNVRSTIFVVSDIVFNTNEVENEKIVPMLQNLKSSMFFYLLHVNSSSVENNNQTVWKQVIMLKNVPQVVFNDLTFKKNGVIQEQYDLKQLQIEDIQLGWSPFSIVEDCDSEGRQCKNVRGVVPDLVKSLSEKFNFTWSSTKDPNGDWGTLPKDESPFDIKKGKWGGVMGGVIKGDYHTSFTGWTWNLQREAVLDLVMFRQESTVLAIVPKPPDVDILLFIRPFRNNAWHLIILVTFVLIIFILTPYILCRTISWEDSQGFMVTKTTAWIFFFLLNAFYGGAMTMFFASEIDLPFATVREAMRSFPGN